jgi:hypothetical protein
VAPRLLDVRPDEWRAVGPALGLAFLAVGAQTLATIASTSLFVSAFASGQLSGFYVVTALLRVGISLGYGVVVDRLRGARADTALLAVTAATTIASGLFAHAAGRPLLYAVCVLLQVLPTLLPLAAMNAAMDCFHARQAKRLLPLVAAAATVGAVVAGAVTVGLAVAVGTGALLVLAGALCLAATPLPTVLAARSIVHDGAHGAPAPVVAKAKKPAFFASIAEGLRDLGAVPVVRIFAVNALLAQATIIFVDVGLNQALKASYDRDEMSAFLARLILVIEVVVLFAQLFLTNRFLGRFGIRAALAARPAAVLALSPLSFLPGVWPATAVKFTEMSTRMAISGAVADLLLAPTPARMRTRVKLFAKSVIMPVGALAAGLVLVPFGEAGPPRAALGALIAATTALSVVALLGVRRAYTAALAQALGEGRVTLEVSPGAAPLLRGELGRLLEAAVREGDAPRAEALVSVMSDRLFQLEDLAPALAAPDSAARRAVARAALRVARPGEGEALLAMLPAGDDDALERDVLAAARGLGAAVDGARIDRALGRGDGDGEAAAGLWAEALSARAQTARDAAVKRLRKAALGPDSPRRAAAIRALGDLDERRAEVEILRALGSADPAVYAEAARAAVRIGATGALPTLIQNLEAGVQIRITVRALSLAGPSAVGALLSALPTTRGEGAFRTAVAGGRGVAGTVRAARVLARLGPEACQRALARFGELGFRARGALARALATVPEATARALDPAPVQGAMELTVAYAETLTRAHRAARPGLLRAELQHRIVDAAHGLLDLASVLGNRDLIARARPALGKDARDRGNALELLENVLPRGFAARTVALLEFHGEAPSADPRGGPGFDGWLSKCGGFDAGTLGSEDPMLAVLEKLVVLREAPLFGGLSGEELYPVGEIAQLVVHAPGDVVVKQGDPGDALFVVARGTLRVIKDGKALREIQRGAVFGEVALLDGAPRAATVEAVTDAELLRVPRSEFEALLDESPEIARAVIRMLLGYLRGAS